MKEGKKKDRLTEKKNEDENVSGTPMESTGIVGTDQKRFKDIMKVRVMSKIVTSIRPMGRPKGI